MKKRKSKKRVVKKQQNRHLYWAGWVIVLVAALLIGGRWMNGGMGQTAQPAEAYWEGLETAGTSIGPSDAPVLIEEYFDFQCPYCQQSAREVVKPLIEQYVADGNVRFRYRFYPVLGPESVLAAQGAYCAAMQGEFWPYQAVLFREEGRRNQGTYSEAKLVQYAREISLDVKAFEECLVSPEAQIYLEGSMQQGQMLGIRSVPSYVINGRPVSVADRDALWRAIDQALEDAAR